MPFRPSRHLFTLVCRCPNFSLTQLGRRPSGSMYSKQLSHLLPVLPQALFRQPRRLLRRPAGWLAAELPAEAAAAPQQASGSHLQHAVSISPLTAAQQGQQEDSLESMLLGRQQGLRAGSRSRQRTSPARSGGPSRAACTSSSAAGRCSRPDALDAAMCMAVPAPRRRCTADPAARLAAAQQEAQHLQGG